MITHLDESQSCHAVSGLGTAHTSTLSSPLPQEISIHIQSPLQSTDNVNFTDADFAQFQGQSEQL